MTDADLNERLSVSKRWSFLRPREQGGGRVYSDAPNEAAAELTRLQAENERLREALVKIAAEENVYRGHGDYTTEPYCTAEQAQSIARAALTAKGDSHGNG